MLTDGLNDQMTKLLKSQAMPQSSDSDDGVQCLTHTLMVSCVSQICLLLKSSPFQKRDNQCSEWGKKLWPVRAISQIYPGIIAKIGTAGAPPSQLRSNQIARLNAIKLKNVLFLERAINFSKMWKNMLDNHNFLTLSNSVNTSLSF